MRKLRIKAPPNGVGVPHFDHYGTRWIKPGDEVEVPDAKHWRKALKKGDVLPCCELSKSIAGIAAPASDSKKKGS